MDDRLSLNFFTNICEVDPNHYCLFETAESFLDCFHLFPGVINIYVHPQPLTRSFAQYKSDLETFFARYGGATVIRTDGLADGYRKSLLSAKTRYLFQLEHDWLFERTLIKHGLQEILNAMEATRAEYLRFGKEPNRRNSYGHEFVEAAMGPIPACSVLWRSNNPHIINAAVYRERYIDFIALAKGGSGGVEECLPEAPGALVYGGLDYPPTIRHTNGRRRLTRFRKSIGKFAYGSINQMGLLEPAFKLWLRKYTA